MQDWGFIVFKGHYTYTGGRLIFLLLTDVPNVNIAFTVHVAKRQLYFLKDPSEGLINYGCTSC